MSALRLSPAVQSLKPSATLAAAAKAKDLKSKGINVYDFTLGEPDFITPANVRQAAVAAMEAGHTHYTPSGGIPELKKAVCAAYKRDYGLDFTAAQVLISNGAKHSIHNVIASLCGPGDEVIIPAPYWVSYSALVELTGALPVIVDTSEASGFCMSADQFRNAITPRTRLMMLNNPSNPTGATYPVDQLEALARVAVEHDIPVLSDEIYEKLLYAGAGFRCFASFGADVAARTIIVSGVSKAYAMTGWRIGWTIGPVEVIGNDIELPGGGIEAVDLMVANRAFCPDALVIRDDPVGRVGEPDGPIGFHHNIIGAVQPLALKIIGQHGD